MGADFDELNKLYELVEPRQLDGKGINYEQYFGEMEISEEEKERRKSLAEKFETVFFLFLLLFLEKKNFDYETMIYESYIKISTEFLEMKSTPYYIEKHAKELAEEVVRATKENDEEFYTSKDRGTLISANEANTVGNYNQHIQAIKKGKKYKTWITEKDSKVRETHREVDERKIGIFEPFQVGNSLMMFPKDSETYGAETKEIAGCRCVVKYS